MGTPAGPVFVRTGNTIQSEGTLPSGAYGEKMADGGVVLSPLFPVTSYGIVPAEDRLSSRASSRTTARTPIPMIVLRIPPHGTVQLIKGCFLPKARGK